MFRLLDLEKVLSLEAIRLATVYLILVKDSFDVEFASIVMQVVLYQALISCIQRENSPVLRTKLNSVSI